MKAFPKDSANNALGGAPIDPKTVNHNQYFGNPGEEAYADFSSGARRSKEGADYRPNIKNRSQSFDPVARVDPVHGDETLGLGTSTFLEGAPASRTAIQTMVQRRESEVEPMENAGGLSRTKSIAQRIQRIRSQSQSNTRARPNRGSSAVNSAEAAYSSRDSDVPKKANEINPFDNEYDQAYDKKGETIQVTEREEPSGHQRTPSSPKRNDKRATIDNGDGTGSDEGGKQGGGGFLQRVKSLKTGARKIKPENFK